MFGHHQKSVENVIEYFQEDNSVEALLLGGSIAHGYEKASSDIDIMIMVSEKRHAELASQNKITFLNKDLCTYPGGYVDGKFLPFSFLREVAETGSEPARFAFQGAHILFSRNVAYEKVLKSIVQYPSDGKTERLRRFYAQMQSWYWYFNESIKQNNSYLMWLSVSKMVLFGGRLILTHNEMLYPYHKWFLRVLEDAKDKPSGIVDCIQHLYKEASAENAARFFEMVKNFRNWGVSESEWTAYFVRDCEWNWRDGKTPIDDI